MIFEPVTSMTEWITEWRTNRSVEELRFLELELPGLPRMLMSRSNSLMPSTPSRSMSNILNSSWTARIFFGHSFHLKFLGYQKGCGSRWILPFSESESDLKKNFSFFWNTCYSKLLNANWVRAQNAKRYFKLINTRSIYSENTFWITFFVCWVFIG